MKNLYILFICLTLCVANSSFFAFLNNLYFHLNLGAEFPGMSSTDMAFLAILLAPLLETFLIQLLPYIFFKKICKLKNDLVAVFMMSVLFAFLHWYNWLYIIAAFFGGLILNSFYVYIYKKDDFLIAFWLTVLLHTLYNIYATFV